GQLVDLLALLADDRADAAGGHDDRDPLAGPLDADVGDRRPLLLAVLLVGQVLLDELPDLGVLDQQLGEVLLVGVPGAPPRPHDARAEPGRPDLLTHSGVPYTPPG